MYPRHFGVTFRRREDFDALLLCAQSRDIPFFRPCQTRFEGAVESHLTFVLVDPSGNLLEFKHYRDPRMIY
jgi:extradiol dioxygenase family protein